MNGLRNVLVVVAVVLSGVAFADAPTDVLVAVQPASESLTRAKHERIVNFIEWAFKAPLTQQQRQRLGDIVLTEWKTAEGRDDMKGWLDGADETEKFPAEQRPLVREKLLEVILPALKESAKTDADAKWFLGVWEGANQPLVKGNPPLMRQAVEATVEMLFFTLAKAHGLDAKPSEGDYDDAVKRMVAAWPKMPAAQKKEIAGAPMQWADLRAAWDAASPADRDEVAEGWRKAFPLPEAKPNPFNTTVPQRNALAKLKEVEDALNKGADAKELQRLAGELGGVAKALEGEAGSQALAAKVTEVQAGLSRAAQQKANATQVRSQAAQSVQDLNKRMQAMNAMNQAFRSQMQFMEQMRMTQFNMNQNLGNNPYRYTNSFGHPY